MSARAFMAARQGTRRGFFNGVMKALHSNKLATHPACGRAQFEAQIQTPLLAPGMQVAGSGRSATALCVALTQALTPWVSGVVPGGTILLLAPSGAGKTTHVKAACDRAKTAGVLRGAAYVDFCEAADPVRTPANVLLGRYGAHVHSILDVLPKTAVHDTRPVVLVCDNVDRAHDKDAMYELLRILTKLSADSAADVSRFLVLALMDTPDMAKFLLNINGGTKVHMLAHGASLVGGDKIFGETSWQHRGLKWDEVACRHMIAETVSAQLTVAQKERLVELSVQCGKPAFIGDFATACQSSQDVDEYLHRAQGAAAAGEREWRACADVSNRPLNPSDKAGLTWHTFPDWVRRAPMAP
jgi:hypothetical protein